MRTLLLQQTYPGSDYIDMIELTKERHEEYCRSFGIEYQLHVCGELHEPGGWEKLRLVKERFEQYDLIIWLDADAFIEDVTVDLRTVPTSPDSIGAIWFPVPRPHWNVGVMYFRPGKETSAFLDKWLARYPGEGDWHEQQVFQELAVMWNAPVITLPDEWNSSLEHNWKGKRIISAFHGCRNRLQVMKEYFGE